LRLLLLVKDCFKKNRNYEDLYEAVDG
jgi:hypothetical protein